MPFITIPNNKDAKETIDNMRKYARYEGVEVTVRGRCKKRRQVFAKTGRYYHTHAASSNDIYMGSKEAPYCHSWAIYIKTIRRG